MPNEPEPFVPPDTDLSALPWLPLNIEHLLASELVAIGTPEECWAALLLWCHAWRQVPAGSLPNDERRLAALSGAGKRWAKVREVALHGFVLCSDGRLYHKFLCAEVLQAHAKQEAYQRRRDTDRKRLEEWRLKRVSNGGGNAPDTRQTITIEEGSDTPLPDAYASSREVSGAVDPPAPLVDPVKELWDRGLTILGRKHRALLGKLVKQCGQIAVLGAIAETEREQPVDPVAYFIKCCEGRRRNGGSQEHAYEVLARAAIEYDERQSGRGPAETLD